MESGRKRLVIFASGNGSNAERLISFFKDHHLAEIVSVFCNNPLAGVINKAEAKGVSVFIFNREDLKSGKVLDKLRELKADLIVLAGFLWLMPEDIVNSYKGRIINIHPALLPGYGGKGMYGMNVHKAVIAAGEKESGISIHIVDPKFDEGEILFQSRCRITEDDTPETLASKVQQLEHQHFPFVIEEYLKTLSHES